MYPLLFKSSWVSIHSYSLLMGLAWGVGYYLLQNILVIKKVNIKHLSVVFWGLLFVGWVGAKTFFLIYSSGAYFDRLVVSPSFWMGGGFVFYGGAIFGVAYLLIFNYFFKSFKFKDLYVFVPSLALGHGIGRVGCFLSGCCYGTICDLPWKINLHGKFRHPVQLYESFGLFVIAYFLVRLIKINKTDKVIPTYLVSYGVIRFIAEIFRGDKIRGIHSYGLSTSQYISILIVVAGVILFKKNKSTIV